MASASFEYFVILAEMRTGSNFLEASLGEYPGLSLYGELFNPSFIRSREKAELLGMTMENRDADPAEMIRRVKDDSIGLPGFRLFHDHHRQAINMCLDDPSCAKIVLLRNPLDSYVSEKIAKQTDQWRLGDMNNAKTAQVRFDAVEFDALLQSRMAFQKNVMHRLQVSGQTAFYLSYEDISDSEVLNGLVRFLGLDAIRKTASRKTKKQNPQPVAEKVTNFEEMQRALASIDYFELGDIPNFEPRRGPGVPGYIAASSAPIMFMPIPGGPNDVVLNWMARLDGVDVEALRSGFTRTTLRDWMKANTPHSKFAVLRHPVRRLHAAYARHSVSTGPDRFSEMVETLKSKHGMPIPSVEDEDYGTERHKEGFLAFIRFVKAGLGGQTSLRVDPSWASQSEILAGMAEFALPDLILREDHLKRDLGRLAFSIGHNSPTVPVQVDDGPVSLDDIYDETIEAAVRNACQRDYVSFGFGAWK